MSIKLINIGFGNIVSANRLIAIVSPESAPIKRIIQDARTKGSLIDATYGRRTRAVLTRTQLSVGQACGLLPSQNARPDRRSTVDDREQ